MKSRITKRNQLFIQEYLQCLNGSEAVRRVYPNIKRANSYAVILLSKDVIKNEIEKYYKKLIMSEEDILKSISTIALDGKIESNKLRAMEILARIKGLLKEHPTMNIAIFKDIETMLDKKLNKSDTIISDDKIDNISLTNTITDETKFT